MRGVDALEPRCRLIRISIVAGGGLIDVKIDEAPRVIRLEPRRRLAHDVEIEIMHARLVQNDMREFRQPVLDVLNPPAADNVVALFLVRLPECRLVDPAGFLRHALGKAVGLKHLHRAAGDAVGLAAQQRAGLLFDDAGLDVGEGGQLGRERQTGRPAADDEDINFLWKSTVSSRRGMPLRRIGDFRVAGLETVEMELHETSPRLTGAPGLAPIWTRRERLSQEAVGTLASDRERESVNDDHDQGSPVYRHLADSR